MVEPVRHRRTKGAATDMFYLTPPRHISTLPILLQKSFLADEQNFIGALMRFARGDVSDHIVSHKNDHGPSWRRYRPSQRQRRLKINFREIFGVVRISTFATKSAKNRRSRCDEPENRLHAPP